MKDFCDFLEINVKIRIEEEDEVRGRATGWVFSHAHDYQEANGPYENYALGPINYFILPGDGFEAAWTTIHFEWAHWLFEGNLWQGSRNGSH